jgi:hypothetical protein
MHVPSILTSLLQYLVAKKDVIEAITGGAAVTGFLFKGWPKVLLRWREETRKYQLRKKINAQDYTLHDIERAVTYYIDPQCQVVDPGGAEDFRHVYPVRQNLFEVVDDLLNKQTVNKFSLVLGDTGMGKTSFLLNYYARHWQSTSKRRRFSLKLIPLGAGDAIAEIADVTNKSDTVLFLDALDEDTLAIGNSRQRFRQLVERSGHFKHVLITCRTQFFSQDEEIPKEAGIIKVGPIGPGESRELASTNSIFPLFPKSKFAVIYGAVSPSGNPAKGAVLWPWSAKLRIFRLGRCYWPRLNSFFPSARSASTHFRFMSR